MGGAAQLAEGATLQRAQHDAQRRAVAEHRHGLAVVLLRDLRQRRNKPIQHLLRRFAVGHLPAIQVAVEVHDALLVLHAQLLPRLPLPDAHVHLPQIRVGVQRQSLGQVHGLGGGAGAEKVAAVYGVDGDVLKTPAQHLDLLIASGGDESVIVPVGNAVQVSLRLGVAD